MSSEDELRKERDLLVAQKDALQRTIVSWQSVRASAPPARTPRTTAASAPRRAAPALTSWRPLPPAPLPRRRA